jgi:hypothetical protein
MKISTLSIVALLVCFAASTAWSGTITFVGKGNGALQHNGTTKIDITDPDNDNVIDTAEWGTGPTASNNGGAGAGTFNGPNNGSEHWAKVFDNHAPGGTSGNTGPWGGNTSKMCCNFLGGTDTNFVEMHSSTTQYNITGYTIANTNDSSPQRDPTAWRLEGSNNGGTTWSNIDTVTGHSFGGTDEVWEVAAVDTPGDYSSFRFVFTASGGGLAIGEIEVFGTVVPEPSTFALAAFGLLGLMGFRRRRQR